MGTSGVSVVGTLLKLRLRRKNPEISPVVVLFLASLAGEVEADRGDIYDVNRTTKLFFEFSRVLPKCSRVCTERSQYYLWVFISKDPTPIPAPPMTPTAMPI